MWDGTLAKFLSKLKLVFREPFFLKAGFILGCENWPNQN